MNAPGWFDVPAYRRNGYAVLPGFKTARDVAALQQRAAEIVDAFDPTGAGIFTTRDQAQNSDAYFLESGDKIRCFLEEDGVTVNKIGHAMHDLDSVFDRFSRDAGLAEIADAIGIERPLLYQSMYIFKQPRVGGEVRWHQDASFFYTEPLSVTAFWFAIDDATRENGCLWVQPGGHRTPLRQRFTVRGGAANLETIDDPMAADRRCAAGRSGARNARRVRWPPSPLQCAESLRKAATRVYAARGRRCRTLRRRQLAAAPNHLSGAGLRLAV